MLVPDGGAGLLAPARALVPMPGVRRIRGAVRRVARRLSARPFLGVAEARAGTGGAGAVWTSAAPQPDPDPGENGRDAARAPLRPPPRWPIAAP